VTEPTGAVRGLRCQPCITALRAFCDEAVFQRVVQYLTTAIARGERYRTAGAP
jgi:hypothetical protein